MVGNLQLSLVHSLVQNRSTEYHKTMYSLLGAIQSCKLYTPSLTLVSILSCKLYTPSLTLVSIPSCKLYTPSLTLVSSSDLIQRIYRFWYNTRDTGSDPRWGWFWVWDQNYSRRRSYTTNLSLITQGMSIIVTRVKRSYCSLEKELHSLSQERIRTGG